MASERIQTLVGITPKRLNELEQAEAKLAAVREVLKKLQSRVEADDIGESYYTGMCGAVKEIKAALEATA